MTALSVWPLDLPTHVLAGASLDPGADPLRSQNDTGPANVRPRATARVRTWDAQVALSGEQMATLETFWAVDLAMGSLQFQWLDPAARTSKLFRFVTKPVFRHLEADRWRAGVKLEILPGGD